LGDDDGLCIDSIQQINQLLNLCPTEAIVWKKIEYHWPDFFVQEFKNLLSIPQIHQISKYEGSVSFLEAIKMRKGYNQLPCIYNSFIKLDLIKKIQTTTDNVFFRSLSPDIFSGFIIGYFINSYIYSSYPFSINGASKYSNGWLGMNPSINPIRLNEFYELSKNGSIISSNNYLIGIRTIGAGIIDSLNAAKDVFGDIINENLNFYLEELIKEVQCLNEERYNQSFESLVLYLQELGKIELLQIMLEKYPRRIFPIKPEHYGYNPASQSIILNGDKFDVENVFDAAVLCNKLLMPWFQFIESDPLANIDEKSLISNSKKNRIDKIKSFFGRCLLLKILSG